MNSESNYIVKEISSLINKVNLFCRNNDLKVPESLNSAGEMLSSAHLNVGIIGSFNSGKSTLLNCMIGKDILPRGFLPTTAAITTVDYAENEELKYELRDGQVQTAMFKNENLKSLISVKKLEEDEEVSRVWIKYPTNYGHNVTFIDTPGVDDIDEWRSMRTMSVLAQVDVAILLFVHPVTSTVLNFLKETVIERDIKKIFFCMTHIDKGGVRENLDRVIAENEREFEKALGFKPVIHSLDLLGCLNSITKTGQKSEEFIQFENEFRCFIESSEAQKVLFGRVITKIQYAVNEIRETLRSRLELTGKSKKEVEEIIVQHTKKIDSLRIKNLELLEKMDDQLTKLYDNIEQSLNELTLSLQNDIDLELNGYMGEIKPFIESRLPILIKKEILGWENTRKPIIVKYIKTIQDNLAGELTLVSKIKKLSNTNVPAVTKELNNGNSLIIKNNSIEVIQTTQVAYEPKQDNQLYWNIGAVAAALVTGQFYLAFAPMIFDRLFGISKKKTLKEKEAARPVIRDYIQNAMINFKDKILFEIDSYRKNMKTFINEEIEAQITITEGIIEGKNTEIEEIELDNEQKRAALLEKISELDSIGKNVSGLFDKVTALQ